MDDKEISNELADMLAWYMSRAIELVQNINEMTGLMGEEVNGKHVMSAAVLLDSILKPNPLLDPGCDNENDIERLEFLKKEMKFDEIMDYHLKKTRKLVQANEASRMRKVFNRDDLKIV